MLTSIANKRRIEEATSQKDDVAPRRGVTLIDDAVYLLEEVWQLVSTSGQDTALGMVDFINRRLAHKSPIVKQKTLRLIKFLCGKGASDFKRGISKQAGTVRELTHYKGDPDPFKGDTPNQKVRDMAKEAVEAIFAPTDTPSYTTPSSSSLQSRIQGFGSSQGPDQASTSSTGTQSRAGMLGFGNPRYDSSRNVSRNSSSKGFGRRGGYEGPGEAAKSGMIGSGALSPKGIIQSISAKGGELMQGRRGQGFLSNDDSTGYSSDEADRGYDQPRANPSPQPSSLAPRQKENGSHMRSTGGDAARLVNQICTPGGLRAQPSREDLRIFVESVGSQDGQQIAELLEDKVSDPSWQAALRALSALEAVIQHGSSVPCGEIAVYFQTNYGALEAALDFPQASVRQRASRVLHLLGIESGATEASTRAAEKLPAAPVPDLLGGLTEDPPAAQDKAQPSANGDMLGDLLEAAPPTQNAESSGMFSGLDFSSHSTAPAQQGAEVDFFGNSAPAPTPQAATPHQSPAAVQSDSDPFLDFQSTARGQQSAEHQPDLFGGLSTGHKSGASQPGKSPVDLLGGVGSATPAASRVQNTDLADMFGGLSGPSSGGGAGVSMQPTARQGSGSGGGLQRQPSPLQIASQRTTSLDKHADPLASIGLPQSQQAPMGQGSSAQRGAPAVSSMPGLQPQQFGAATMGVNFPGAQLTPQQIQYMRQIQYMQYMQHMQAMQARGMAGAPQQQMAFAQNQGHMPGLGGFQSPAFNASAQNSGAQGPGGGGPISLDSLTGPSSAAPSSNSVLGISQQSDFDFVNDHVKGLRSKR